MEASGSSVGCAAVSLLLYLMERGAELAVLVHYFLTGQYTWASCTLALLIPGCLVQALSFAWFRKEGPAGGFTVTLIHVLQLGILKRQADCLQVALREGKRQKPGNERELLMQQGDAALLRLVEALLQALPHLLLQTYIYLALEYTNAYAVASALLSLLSLSWALVSYSRFLCLLKPGHLSMPWASLLCQLLWRMGMIGTRAMALAVFARVYHFWVFAVAGAHWLVMSFWLVAQQTDLISRPCYWKLFNALVGAVYVFCFLNVRDGPSRYRVAIFYTVMLLENAILLLLATDFLQGVLWSNVRLTVVVMCGFLIGCAALIIYYTLLHPKSTQISQSFRKMAHVVRARRDTFPRNNHHGPSERADGDTFSTAANLKCPTSDSEGLVHWLQKSSRRHYWLLLKLAMKTGNVSKINTAFGDCDFGLTFSPGCPESIPNGGCTCIKHAESDHCRQPESPDFVILESERWVFGKTEVESASYVTLGKTGAEDNKVNEAREERNPGVSPSSRDAPQENGTLYFSANTEELLHSANVEPEKPGAASVEPIQTPTKEIPAQEGARTEVYPAICVSPILSLATNSNFQRSIAPDVGSLCDDSSMSNDEADVTEAEELPGERARLLLAPGLLAPSLRGRLIPEEKPCFTSTPKPQTASAEPGLREDSKTKRKLLEP